MYQNICENIIFAYCWAHLRRDFIRIYDARKKLQPWAKEWIEGIAEIYKINNQRLKEIPCSESFQTLDKKLRENIKIMKEVLEEQLEDDNLHQVAKKVLKSLNARWKSYVTFVDHPEIPMDNNFAERQLRNPVVGRKNYYGSGSTWSATLASSMFTSFQTLLLNKIHPRKFLKIYFEKCAQNNGKPPDNIQPFLPWNLTVQQKNELAVNST